MEGCAPFVEHPLPAIFPFLHPSRGFFLPLYRVGCPAQPPGELPPVSIRLSPRIAGQRRLDPGGLFAGQEDGSSTRSGCPSPGGWFASPGPIAAQPLRRGAACPRVGDRRLVPSLTAAPGCSGLYRWERYGSVSRTLPTPGDDGVPGPAALP